MASGDGCLSDVDRLNADTARRTVLGLGAVPNSRRLGEYLSRFDERALSALYGVVQTMVPRVIGDVIDHLESTRGYVPVFVDGSEIEVSGSYEEAHRGYTGNKQYWLHSVFVGPLWAAHRLNPGGGDVAGGWESQLDEVLPMLKGHRAWLMMDNAYYRRSIVEYARRNKVDYSISVTNDGYKAPIFAQADVLPESAWSWLDSKQSEDAAIVYHQPEKWDHTATYVVVRRWVDDHGERLMIPFRSVILVSRSDLPLAEIVHRHRSKQGLENAQKGPLLDLDLHHPPCEKYNANRAFYMIGHLAQLVLVAMQYRWLPATARSHGIRMIIRDLIRTAARLVRHGRRWILKFSKTAWRLDWLIAAATASEAPPG